MSHTRVFSSACTGTGRGSTRPERTMTRTDRPTMPTDALPPSAEASELARAAADLEALADAYDRCAHDLDAIESAVDTLLDDDALCA
ncbi:MAG TPA: hypothetical protein VJM49_12560, partial [Acidimicrobiales bacterium]|nr:hypothetical protein [Acidimicrobiales bacterium]